MKKTIYKILVVVWMCFIFYMSSKQGDDSNSLSLDVVNIFKNIGIDMTGIFGDLANFIVRKSAHITEYFILTFLIYNSINDDIREKKGILLTLALSVLYASTDEFHQLFVKGRSGRIEDILIDSIGIAIYLIFKLIKNYVNSRKINI